jgi:hypothetical protein
MHPASVYRHAIRAAPVLCLGGLVTTVAGNIGDKLWLFQFGASLFLSGVVVWGFANGFLLIYGLVHRARRSRFKNILAHPWPLALSTVWALFYLSIGVFFVWFILRRSIDPN